MIEDIDLILTDRGSMVLVVPGVVPPGALSVEILQGGVRILASGFCFAQVTGVDGPVLDALAAQGKTMGLIALSDPTQPPVDVTHTATLLDRRIF